MVRIGRIGRGGGGVKITIDQTALDRLAVEISDEAVSNAARLTAYRVKRHITASGRVRRGNMRRATKYEPHRRRFTGRNKITYRVWSDVPYAWWQNRGVGIIRPKRARVLRFVPKGSRKPVFAAFTRGFEGAKFYEKALQQLRAADFRPKQKR